MKKKFKDLASIKIEIDSPVPREPTIQTLSDRKNDVDRRILEESSDAREYMARMLGGGVPPSSRQADRRPSREGAAPSSAPAPCLPPSAIHERERAERMAKELEGRCRKAEEQLSGLMGENRELRQKIESLEREKAERNIRLRALETLAEQKSELALNMDRRNRALQEELATVKEDAEAALHRSRLLTRPEAEELFPNEMDEHLREALAEALRQAENAGRDRHADILREILKINPAKGSLSEKRDAIADIFGNCQRIGEREIRALEEIGFKLVAARNHYKFRMGNYAVTVSKTPSDWRSNSNLKAEIFSRFF